MKLPIEEHMPSIDEPRFLLLVSDPKIGKTSNTMRLPKSLLVDFENSGEFYKGRSINLQKEAIVSKKGLLVLLRELKDLLETEISKNGKSPYDFGIIDSATMLEDCATELATLIYKTTLAGKNYTGTDVVSDLPKGAGYKYLREAFEKILYPFIPLFNKCLILIVHIKDKDIEAEGDKTITVKDLNLTGKLKLITPAKADGIAQLYRKDNKNYISFKNAGANSLALGVRAVSYTHLTLPTIYSV